MMGWGNQGYGMGGFGGIVMILFWVIIIIGIVVLIRYLIPGQGQGKLLAAKRDPLEIFQERYAKGEIDTDEYEERRKVLQSGR